MKQSRFALLIQMLIKFGLGFLIIGVILFAAAGSLAYRNGWVFIAALAGPMAVFGAVLLIKDPATLARRLKSKEADPAQRMVIALSGGMFIVSFVIAGLDYRFGWSSMPPAGVVISLAVMLLGYLLFVAVILQNAYAARVVEVAENQKIITGGLYSVVRHPMYTASLLIFLAMPLVLGSYFALLPMLLYPAMIVRRIKGEEALLVQSLAGYSEYRAKVKYRLLPFIW